uniref:Uncharacterized protein n=1 Tax=Anopheles melas TaxID=34690 RepID=A0A182UAC8_9DIPT
MLTRRHVDTGILPVVYIAEATYFSLVAPHNTEINLPQSLLRPFSYEVWLFIVGCAVVISILNELSQYDTRMGVWLRWIYSYPTLPSFYSICFTLISFVLIESYLATVTSFFLAYRFVPDAKTLEDFFATDIPIRLEEGMDTFLNNLEPRVSDLIVARGVRGTECEEFSSGCAHLDTFARAWVRIKELVGVDPISGRKRSYIVLEMVARYSCMSYAFARDSPLTVVVAVYLRWMYEAGLVRLFHQDYEQYLQPNDYEHTHEDSLAFEHLMSLW